MINKNLIIHHISQSKDERGLLVGEIKKRIQATWKEARSFSINTVRRAVYELVDEDYLKANWVERDIYRYTLTDKPNDINLFYIGVGRFSDDDESFNPVSAYLHEGKESFEEFVDIIRGQRKMWTEEGMVYPILIHQRGREGSLSISPIGKKESKKGFFSEQYCIDVFGF